MDETDFKLPSVQDNIDFEINVGVIVFLVFCFFLGIESANWSVVRRKW